MIPKSALEKILLASCLFPLYINKATMTNDPIERVYIFLISKKDQIANLCNPRKLLY